MTERFLKFIPSEEAFWLLENKPNAFRLLTHIANTARRYEGHPEGLHIGQCHLQNCKKYKMTMREYRTAKTILIQRNHIKIIETNRTRKKSTTGTTTASTLVELISSTVYDINNETYEHKKTTEPTTDRQLTDNCLERSQKEEKQEREEEKERSKEKEEEKEEKEEKKKEREATPSRFPTSSKIKFREYVELTQTEHDSLLAKHGYEILTLMLDKLDAFKGSTGKKYKSDYHTMKEGGWVVTQVKKDHEKTFRFPEAKQINGSSQEPRFQPSRVLRSYGPLDQGGGYE